MTTNHPTELILDPSMAHAAVSVIAVVAIVVGLCPSVSRADPVPAVAREVDPVDNRTLTVSRGVKSIDE